MGKICNSKPRRNIISQARLHPFFFVSRARLYILLLRLCHRHLGFPWERKLCSRRKISWTHFSPGSLKWRTWNSGQVSKVFDKAIFGGKLRPVVAGWIYFQSFWVFKSRSFFPSFVPQKARLHITEEWWLKKKMQMLWRRFNNVNSGDIFKHHWLRASSDW